jgi:phosphate transport system protein
MTTTRVPFDEELALLRTHVQAMGAALDGMLELAVRAVVEQDEALTDRVLAAEDEVDGLDREIEKACLRLIVLQQPVARDLREIGTAFKVVTDLERIGDYAVDIAKIGRRLARRGVFYKPVVDLPRIGGMVRDMLGDVMRAYVACDVDLVTRVVEADDAVDDVYHQYRDYTIEAMRQDTSLVYLGTFVVLATKYLERAGDHLVNVAERVHYLVTGDLEPLARIRKRSQGAAPQQA